MQPSLAQRASACATARACGGTQRALRALRVYDGALVGLVLWTLVHTSKAFAGDQAPPAGEAAGREFTGARPTTAMLLQRIPDPYRVSDAGDAARSSPAEFCPRKQSTLAEDWRAAPLEDESIMRSTSIWQRLNDSRTRGRFQLVTLWETGGNSLSLQAGRKGNPTLQWTSRLMSHGSGPRGLFDDLFGSTAGSGSGHGFHFIGRSNTDAAAKPPKAAEAAAAGNTGK